ncbi:CaaX farnesyltransferase beta subunit Ram1 [Usnea florida]
MTLHERGVIDSSGTDASQVPELFTSLPPIRDPLVTDTSLSQDETAEDCLPFHDGTNGSLFDLNSKGIPRLRRGHHVKFLNNAIQNAKYIAYDPQRPWLVYWCLTGLGVLGQDLEKWRDRVLDTFSPLQNPSGGFGGGHGQISHAAPSYAVVLSLAMVGGKESLDMIDRRTLWRWLGELKQSDGGFRMSVGGEEDVRGAYCAMTIISLLAIPLELPPNAPSRVTGFTSFLDGLPEYLSRCQTFEGGISGAPQTEAHGAYAFCVLACLCILGPPHKIIPKYLNLPLLMSWLSARQYAPEGGFSGRTNKLVDGCYSHWVGGCWPLIEAALNGPQTSVSIDWPRSSNLYSKEGLTRYILSCCQKDSGGFRDKPSTFPDSYHSCYVLAGLSSTQYYNYFNSQFDDVRTSDALGWALGWRSSRIISGFESGDEELVDAEDRLEPLHPIFVIPWTAVERCSQQFSQKTGF